MTLKELAEEVLSLTPQEKVEFMRIIAQELKKEARDTSSPLFNSATYLGIASNWMNKVP